MLKKFITFVLFAFAFLISFAEKTPTENLCNVKIEKVEFVLSPKSILKVELKNLSDKAYKLDLSYQLFEISSEKKLVDEKIKATNFEISPNEKKQVELTLTDASDALKNNLTYKVNVILTYKPEVFIGFFNNDKIIDEKSTTFPIAKSALQKD